MIENLVGIKEIVEYNNTNGIRMYLNDEAEDYPTHWHSATELIIPIENSYTIEVNNKKHIVLPKELLIIPPGQLHALYAPQKGLRIIILFENSLLSSITDFSSLIYNLRPFVIVNKENYEDVYEDIYNIIYEAIDEYHANKTYRELLCFSLFMKIPVLIERSRSALLLQDTTSKISNNYECINNVCNYIDKNFTSDLTLNKLAKIAGYSTFHFSRLFKEYKNETVYNYITRRRVMYAEDLLMLPELNITQVASNSGFESISTFNRVFKNINKCTPTQFINMNTGYGKE